MPLLRNCPLIVVGLFDLTLPPSIASPSPTPPRYPIKEPFVELMKGSLNTFLNAFTYPDRTCYPVASTNTQDYYNLVDVSALQVV